MTVGRHRASRGAAQRAGYVGSLAAAFVVGAAVTGGIGVAQAEGPAAGGAESTPAADSRVQDQGPERESPERGRSTTEPAERAEPEKSETTARSETTEDAAESADRDRRLEAAADSPAATPSTAPDRTAATSTAIADIPAARRTTTPQPTTVRLSTVEPVGRDVQDLAAAQTAAVAPGTPAPTDEVATPFGEIGKWMLTWNKRIANWGGKKYQGKTLLESVNVIIVDPNSTTRAQAVRQLNRAMYLAGFPAQPFHSNGYGGSIDDIVYGQQPRGPLQSYSNDLFLLTNDHGRIFGPDPLETEAGYVWSGAFSTEEFGFSGFLPGHFYVSSNDARNDLATALVGSGQATFGGLVPMENAYNTGSVTTGDHDGFAVVLVLTGAAALARRDLDHADGLPALASTSQAACPVGDGPALGSSAGCAPASLGVAASRRA